MPFNVQFGSHEEPRIRSRSHDEEHGTAISSGLQQFYQGFGFGAGMLIVFLLAYAIASHIAGFPDWHALQTYWLTWR